MLGSAPVASAAPPAPARRRVIDFIVSHARLTTGRKPRLTPVLAPVKTLLIGMSPHGLRVENTHMLRNNHSLFPVIRTAVKLAYKTYGQCGSTRVTPLIVLHGLLGSKKNWESMSKKLASGLDTCAVAADARNHGESPHVNSHSYFDLASDVIKLMDTLGFKRATLIGHSMGGRTAMVVALTQPDKIDRLVVVDISPISTAGILNNFFPRLIDAMKSVNFNGIKNLNDARNVAKNKMITSGVLSDTDGMNFLLMNIAMRKDRTIGWIYNLDTLKASFDLIASFPKEIRNKKFFGHTLFVGGESSNYIPLVAATRDLRLLRNNWKDLLHQMDIRNFFEKGQMT
ncbi:hypothetical protein evm_005079 [Chilo suppressalis]|nr:hypothetical protein evm_005079 [Chilo suppressalis]